MDLGTLGVWSIGIRQVADSAVRAAAAELEQLGYGTIWYSGGSGTRGFDIGRVLLQATDRIAIATGITSIWATTAAQSAVGFEQMEQAAPGRFLLGLGVSHAPMVNQGDPGRYRHPLPTSVPSPDASDSAKAPPRTQFPQPTPQHSSRPRRLGTRC